MPLPPPNLPTPDHLLASSPVRELCSGVDALYLSGRAELSPLLFEVLEEHRSDAEESDGPVALSLAGEEFWVEPRAFGKYRYRLTHPGGLVGVTASEHLPALRVQPRAEFIHGAGPEVALEFFAGVGEYLAGGPVSWSLSRLDLFCDVQGWDLEGDDRRRFVCRADRRDLHEHGDCFGGFEFGRRTTKTVPGSMTSPARSTTRASIGGLRSGVTDTTEPVPCCASKQRSVARGSLSTSSTPLLTDSLRPGKSGRTSQRHG